MDIKEIAEAYSVKYESIPIDGNICFDKENACKIIEVLRCECRPILGADVYRMKNGEVKEFLMPNLYVNRADRESFSAFLQRSCDEAMSFVKNYPYHADSFCRLLFRKFLAFFKNNSQHNDLYFDIVIM